MGRAWAWVGAIGGLAVLVGSRGEGGGAILGLGLLLIGLLGGLIAELIRSRIPGTPPPDPSEPELAPTDGTPEFARPLGVRGSSNLHDPRIRRFEGLDPIESEGLRAPGAADGALLGRIVLVSLFGGADGRSWSDAEVARTYRALWQVAAWIEREAIRWGVSVRMLLSDTYFVADADDEGAGPVEIAITDQGLFEADAVTRATAGFSRAAAENGFADAADLIGRVGSRFEADARVWLVHPRRAGRSYAIPEADTPWPGVSLAVCYAGITNFPGPLIRLPRPDPATLAHELLHLFGATDKYEVPLRRFPPGSVTDRDIMVLEESSLARLRIDPLTAAEIGWTPAPRAKNPPPPPVGDDDG